MSSRKGPITTKAKKKKIAGRADYPSTNISSPIRDDLPQRRIQQHNRSADPSGNGLPRKNARQKKTTHDYQLDDFLTGGEEDDDDFEPARTVKSVGRKKGQKLGCPITVDERLEGLSDLQKDLLEDYMLAAKKLMKQIMQEKNLRNPPFTDTILREMGLDLPRSLQEMRNIRGIDPDRVERYGKRFLKIINNARDIYGQLLPRSEDHASNILDEDEDAPMDPNHQEVILISDDEAVPEGIFDESDDSFEVEDDDEDEDEHLQTSHHFTPTTIDPRVEEYNRRGSQLEAERVASSTSRSRAVSRAPTKTGSKARSNSFKRNFKRKSSSSYGKGYAGVTKKGAATKKSASRKASGNGNTTRRPLGGGGRGGGGGTGGATSNGWSSIMVMPT